MRDDGTFEVLQRGGNLCLRMYPTEPPSDAGIVALTAAFRQLNGLVEMPADRRFIVITVPLAAGFRAVEGAAREWVGDQDCPWEYGNVYDDDGHPLGWWANG